MTAAEIDTHKDTHAVCIVGKLGRMLGSDEFRAVACLHLAGIQCRRRQTGGAHRSRTRGERARPPLHLRLRAPISAVSGNPERLGSEVAFASLCGTSPVEASSDRTCRHRLGRGGNRQTNVALHRIAAVCLRYDGRTQGYAAGRQSEGKSEKEVLRCLKRHIAREVYGALPNPKGGANAY